VEEGLKFTALVEGIVVQAVCFKVAGVLVKGDQQFGDVKSAQRGKSWYYLLCQDLVVIWHCDNDTLLRRFTIC
jgi:hypothetical protein